MNGFVNQTCIGQPNHVHPVGNIGYTQIFVKFQYSRIIFGCVGFCSNQVHSFFDCFLVGSLGKGGGGRD